MHYVNQAVHVKLLASHTNFSVKLLAVHTKLVCKTIGLAHTSLCVNLLCTHKLVCKTIGRAHTNMCVKLLSVDTVVNSKYKEINRFRDKQTFRFQEKTDLGMN